MTNHSLSVLAAVENEATFDYLAKVFGDLHNWRATLERAASRGETLSVMHRRCHDAYLVSEGLGGIDGLVRAALDSGCFGPIIIISEKATDDSRALALKSGASEYLELSEITAPLLERLIPTVLEKTRARRRLQQMLESAPAAMVVLDGRRRIVFVNHQTEKLFGFGREDIIGADFRLLTIGANELLSAQQDGSPLLTLGRRADGSRFDAEVSISTFEMDDEQYGFALVRDVSEKKIADALVETNRARLEQANRRNETVLRSVPHGVCILGSDMRIEYANQRLARFWDPEAGKPEDVIGKPLSIMFRDVEDFTAMFEKATTPGDPDTRHTREVTLVRSNNAEFQCEVSLVSFDPEKIGAGYVATVTDLTSRNRSQQEVRRQVKRLEALRTIDLAITGSIDLKVTLHILLEQVLLHLRMDAAAVLLLNPTANTLDFSTGEGFRTAALQETHLPIGKGLAGKAALERRMVTVADLQGEQSSVYLDSPQMQEEGFRFYTAVPLVAKGHVTGVLEVFRRERFTPDESWLNFLEMLAGQAAIAVDNATLVGDLQRLNTDVTLAYDTTLEGWSRALELRDVETHGHTVRVTDTTMKLARRMGIDDRELIHVRRGALLHDIGKMGIPDSILFKPGPLSPDEWEIMKKHPLYAYELLRPIQFLRPALDIPLHHHERWDGSGYPHGLDGNEIPLGARMFAVVDVWDALLSKRPYRDPWGGTETLDYLQNESGKLFDPDIVKQFVDMARSGTGGKHALVEAGVPA